MTCLEINILDKHTANLIAAGEVVERPASAIKEMLENSADAGASRITVEIQNGGTTYFRVTDDGCGMSSDDLPRSILRHATSKINCASDLSAIGTYGFRGEALAAIAAVCDLRILTKRKEDTYGSVLHVCGGEILESGETGCPDGTTIAASDIFKNVPARRKFLKKDFTEANACLAVTEKFALSRPHIAVTFISDGNIKLKTSGDGILKNTVYSCLGKEFSSKLLELSYEYEGIRIHGFVGKPETARPSRSLQNFFVNKRYVRSGTICAALEEGFRAFCPSGKFPAAVIFCDLDFSRVDVNIHPAKTEVKFSEEKKVFEAVLFAVRTALNKGTSFTEDAEKKDDTDLPFVTTEKPDVLSSKKLQDAVLPTSAPTKSTDTYRENDKANSAQPAKSQTVVTVKPDVPTHKAPDFRNAFAEESTGLSDLSMEFGNKSEPRFVRASIPDDGMEIFSPVSQAKFDIPEVKKEEPAQTSFELNSTQEKKTVSYKVIGQCFDSFILVEKDECLYIIDKHAAHERILYEQIKSKYKGSASQMLLEPIRVSMTTEECGVLMENKEYFSETGFDFDVFGASTIIVRSYPEQLDGKDIPDIFSALAAKLMEGNEKAAGDIFDRALFTAACKAAVKAGQRNTLFHDEYIAEKIFSSEAILYCPHGRPVMTEFSKDKLYKMFKRT